MIFINKLVKCEICVDDYNKADLKLYYACLIMLN